ncbi:MAG: DUF4340 domain-containing protein [Treponema sp.]|nr:DUF4340 domain-containing protein [Treponema sp.]
MNKIHFTQKILLEIICIFLIILYGLSFSFNSKDEKLPYVKTAFINPDKISQLKNISIISSGGENITFVYEDGIWKSSNFFADGSKCTFPIIQSQFIKFLDTIKNVRRLYKIVYNNDKNIKHFDTEFTIFYQFTDGRETSFAIGKKDFSKTMRYIQLNDEKNSIYKTEADFEIYLSSLSSFWYDPYIIPRNLKNSLNEEDLSAILYTDNYKTLQLSSEKYSSILQLRHGHLCSQPEKENYEGKLKIITSGGKELIIDIYTLNEEEKVLSYQIDKSFSYSVKISNWTYKNIRELFGL